MKALKNESAKYVEQIVSAVNDCYANGAVPGNSELMKLYSDIGFNISLQGEKAFVVHEDVNNS